MRLPRAAPRHDAVYILAGGDDGSPDAFAERSLATIETLTDLLCHGVEDGTMHPTSVADAVHVIDRLVHVARKVTAELRASATAAQKSEAA